jgi:hypothetical protein
MCGLELDEMRACAYGEIVNGGWCKKCAQHVKGRDKRRYGRAQADAQPGHRLVA